MITKRTIKILVAAFCGLATFTAMGAWFGGDFDLSWYTVDGGGGSSSTGGDFELSGTIGQPDAGAMTGGDFEMTGGFWFEQPPGDCNATGIADLLDHADFADCLTGPDGGLPMPDCNCFDVDGDGDADLLDFGVFQLNFKGN